MMRVSESWLREWVNSDLNIFDLADRLTMAGLEVASVEPAAAKFDGVVVGHIISATPHPTRPSLLVCEVDAGESEGLYQVVCGADGAREAQAAPFAKPGARLPDGRDIAERDVAGVMSQGMLCSGAELGLVEPADNILVLPAYAPAGADFFRWLGLDDQILEVELTPNRGDCLSMIGFAREVAALSGTTTKRLSVSPVQTQISDKAEVFSEDLDACPHYCGRRIHGISTQLHSPLWLREKLRRSGLRSIHPVVDVTNYVMLELGQPMHSFALDKIEWPVRIGWAKSGQSLVGLDGKSLALTDDCLVVADKSGPLALAGITGGSHSAVQQDTADIFLESAVFSPQAVQGRSRRFALSTDSAYRFERGVDPSGARFALERATQLIMDIVGGQPGAIVESGQAAQPYRDPVLLRLARAERLLGVPVDATSARKTFTALGMRVDEKGDEWWIAPPGSRYDIACEADLVEELGRLKGFDRLPSILPKRLVGPKIPSPEQHQRWRAREYMKNRDYFEIVTYAFTSPSWIEAFTPGADAPALKHPLTQELSVLRSSLWGELLKVLRYNMNRQHPRVRLFESGRCYQSKTDQAFNMVEHDMLAGVAWGLCMPEQWGASARAVDFFDVKADVESLFHALDLPMQNLCFEKQQIDGLHPGRCARILYADEIIGSMGEVHPVVQTTFDLPSQVIVFELEWKLLHTAVQKHYREPLRYPQIRRDLSFLVSQAVPSARILELARQSGGPWFKDVWIFDVYTGANISSGLQSISIALLFQSIDHTLTDSEIEPFLHKIVQTLHAGVHATLRS